MRWPLLTAVVLALLAGAVIRRAEAPQHFSDTRLAQGSIRQARPAPAWHNDNWLNADGPITVVGMHTPEFPPHGGEHDTTNVRRALTRYGISYPNAMDNDRATWRLYGIRYWPSLVLIDKRGQIRYEEFGEIYEGDRRYAQWERRIEALLAE